MVKKYYLDTSIWLDYHEKRGKNGEIALELLKKIIGEGSLILYSNFHILELKHLGYSIGEIIQMFNPFRRLFKIHIYNEEKEMARKIAIKRRIPKGDALHAILAKDNEALLITRDTHFQKLKDIAIIRKPEEVI